MSFGLRKNLKNVFRNCLSPQGNRIRLNPIVGSLSLVIPTVLAFILAGAFRIDLTFHLKRLHTVKSRAAESHQPA